MKRLKHAFAITIVGILLLMGFLGYPRPIPLKVATSVTKSHVKTQMELKHENRLLGKTFAKAGFGWSGKEWACLDRLWRIESKWDYQADNLKSSAYGISQLLGEKSKLPEIQILHGLRYVSKRFGAPCQALRHELRWNWY